MRLKIGTIYECSSFIRRFVSIVWRISEFFNSEKKKKKKFNSVIFSFSLFFFAHWILKWSGHWILNTIRILRIEVLTLANIRSNPAIRHPRIRETRLWGLPFVYLLTLSISPCITLFWYFTNKEFRQSLYQVPQNAWLECSWCPHFILCQYYTRYCFSEQDINTIFLLQDIDGIIKYMEEALKETDPAAFLMVNYLLNVLYKEIWWTMMLLTVCTTLALYVVKLNLIITVYCIVVYLSGKLLCEKCFFILQVSLMLWSLYRPFFGHILIHVLFHRPPMDLMKGKLTSILWW